MDPRSGPLKALKCVSEKRRQTRSVLLVVEWDAADLIEASLRRWIQLWRGRGIAITLSVVRPEGKSIHPISLAD